MLSKDSYYNVNMAHILWRTAHDVVSRAREITVIGYSLPAGDRITSELLRSVPKLANVAVVDVFAGSTNEQDGPVGRATALGLAVGETYDRADAVVEYVRARLDRAAKGLSSSPIWRHHDPDDVVLVSVHVDGDNPAVRSFVISMADGVNIGWEVNWRWTPPTNWSPLVSARQGLGKDEVWQETLLTRTKLAESVAGGEPFRIEAAGQRYVVIGVRESKLGQWHIVVPDLAPA